LESIIPAIRQKNLCPLLLFILKTSNHLLKTIKLYKMSEQSSLFIKVKISKENLNSFLSSRPVASILNSNWLEWWDSRLMYSKTELKNIPSFNSESNKQILEDLLVDKYSICKQEYNQDQGVWYFMSLQYSENYTEILPMLSWIKDLANYTDENDIGDAFIYDFLWGEGTVMAYIHIQNKQASLNRFDKTVQINTELLQEANQMFEDFMNSFEKD